MSNLNDIFFTPAANQELTYDQVLEDVQRYFAENHLPVRGVCRLDPPTILLSFLLHIHVHDLPFSVLIYP